MAEATVPPMVERLGAILKDLYGPVVPWATTETFNRDASLLIVAMSQPTEAMCRVGERFNARLADTPPGQGQRTDMVWGDLGGTVEGYRRMIQAALSPDPQS